ncbi:hypothetical protein [Pseudomonas caspiana]|uniref:hypothetical protein n=1 Tax=Pseudomonas caspiana TaxID=1451454 RepID=UPI001302BD3E|nr:hypothetical protein [Pseudomonas caspiana]
MREKSAKSADTVPATYINAQSAITGLRGQDLFSTLRKESSLTAPFEWKLYGAERRMP